MAPFRRLTGRLDFITSFRVKGLTQRGLRVYEDTEMNEIRRLRKKAGLSQFKLAVRAGVTETTIRNWERRGIADAKYGAAKRLARALGVPMDDLEEEE